MTDTQILEEIFNETTTENDPRLWHVRCCKPAVPRGLCKTGVAVTEIRQTHKEEPDTCVVCQYMWEDGHRNVCPMDSGYWEK